MKERPSFRSSVGAGRNGLHKQDLEDQYSSDNHSLLPYLYMYRFFSDNIGYVLIEPRTRQLILIDAGDFDTSKKVVSEIEKQQRGARLSYILTTHHHNDHQGANLKWKEERPEV
jgi:glyoxylase-like metal-dependent hydrolase (beta-lactamase superfamily II)